MTFKFQDYYIHSGEWVAASDPNRLAGYIFANRELLLSAEGSSLRPSKVKTRFSSKGELARNFARVAHFLEHFFQSWSNA